jgi:hypothetical protein
MLEFNSETEIPKESWRRFQKKALTSAIRIDGPFRVHTPGGPLTCQDGWLCCDVSGYLYPMTNDEFQLIYELYDSNFMI